MPKAGAGTVPDDGAERVPESVSLSSLAAQWTVLSGLQAQVNARVERDLHRMSGIGISEFIALRALAADERGELRMQDLAQATSLNQSSVSRLVARLERTGFTERTMCELDRRGVYTGITDEGRAALRSAVPVFEGALESAVESLATKKLGDSLIKAVRLMPTATTL